MRITYASLSLPGKDESDRTLHAPLAPGYLAAYACSIRGAQDVHTLLPADAAAGASPAEIAGRMLATDPQLLALSVYTWNRELVMQVARCLREMDPHLPIVLGGPEVAFDPAGALRESGADWVCAGEGEIPFAALLELLDEHPGDISPLPGMVSRRAAGRPGTVPAPLVDPLDAVPSPYTSGLLQPQPGGTVEMETMRGCPYGCHFCLYGKNYSHLRYFSLERVRADLSFLVDSQAESIYIIDPTFNIPRGRCLEICRMLKELNPHKEKKIFVEVKAEAVDEVMADAFVEAGIAAVEVGLQTTNPRALALMGRSFDPARFTRGMRLLRERQIWANIGVIAGLPGDSPGQFRDTLRFISDQALGRVLIYPLQVFPGSPFHAAAEALGLKFAPAPSHQVTGTALISAEEMRELIIEIPDLVEETNQPYLRERSRMVLNRLRGWQEASGGMPGAAGQSEVGG